MNTALIGHTGFVGNNIAAHYRFDDYYNSSNIEDMKGKSYDLAVCAGIPSSMWMANHFPEKDLENINQLLSILKTIQAKSFVLISSIAVFSQLVSGCDETTTAFETNIAYGKHRRHAEEIIAPLFPEHLIVRLPALFGDGLKKNFLYDLMNQEPSFITKDPFKALLDALSTEDKQCLTPYYHYDPEKGVYFFAKEVARAEGVRDTLRTILSRAGVSALNFTHAQSRFQFYNLDYIWKDITHGLDENLRCLHLAPEPIAANEIARRFFNINFTNDNGKTPYNHNMYTQYGKYWQKEGCYQYSKEETMQALERFFR